MNNAMKKIVNCRMLFVLLLCVGLMELRASAGEENLFPAEIVLPERTEQQKSSPDSDKEVTSRTLLLNGEGLCEWGFFAIDLYRAALYVEKKSSDPEHLIRSDEAKKIVLVFSRELTAEQLREAYSASFRVNAGDRLAEMSTRIDQLTAMMETVEEGDRLDFTYLPGAGLEVTLNNRKKGTIEGKDFARLFFRLYLGVKPPDEDLKEGLLGIS